QLSPLLIRKGTKPEAVAGPKHDASSVGRNSGRSTVRIEVESGRWKKRGVNAALCSGPRAPREKDRAREQERPRDPPAQQLSPAPKRSTGSGQRRFDRADLGDVVTERREIPREISRRRVTAVGLLRKTTLHDPAEVGRQLRVDLPDRLRLVRHD